MKIPKSFKMFAHEISVIEEKDMHKNDDVWGEARYRKGLIALEPDIKQNYKEQTFCHELVHMIFHFLDERDLAKNEKLVSTFSELLYQFFETQKF